MKSIKQSALTLTVVLLMVLATCVVHADTMATASVSLNGYACPTFPYGGDSSSCPAVSVNVTNSGTSAASASGSGLQATASANYGSLGTSANANLGLIFGMPGNNGASSSASFTDTITTYGPEISGNLAATYVTSGYMGDDEGSGFGCYNIGSASGCFQTRGPHPTQTLTIPFVLGSGNPFTISAYVTCHAYDTSSADPGYGSSTCLAGIFLQQLVFFDSTGQPVAGFGYATLGSGPGYSFEGATEVPEPSSLILLGSGLPALAWAFRRRKRS